MASLRFLTPFHIQIFTWGLISWSAFWASSPLNVNQSDSNRVSFIKVLLAPVTLSNSHFCQPPEILHLSQNVHFYSAIHVHCMNSPLLDVLYPEV